MDWCPVQGEFRTLIEQGTVYRPVPAYMYSVHDLHTFMLGANM